jgi:hypothetical protein
MDFLRLLMACVICSLWVADIAAQELTPRLFWPAPKGTSVLVAGYAYSTGDILFDYSIPIEDADSRINTGILAYAHTLGLWGRTTNFLVELPYSEGTTKGLLLGEPARRDFSDFGDASVGLNVNLRGAPSMNREEFIAFRTNPQPIIGVGLKIQIPTGQYDPNRLINVGANRWAARLKLGTVMKLKQTWLLELSASTWVFGDDNDFISGKKEQKPVFAAETNIIKRIRPGLWASLDITYYTGGRQTIDGKPLRNEQSNVKIGGTLVVPFLRRHAIKIGYADGIITRYGNDFSQFFLSYSRVLK